jgi:prepilin-type processing-associated H-X9-DG protein
MCEQVLAGGETLPLALAREFVPKRDGSSIPLFFDCAHFETYPRDTDPAVLYHHGAPLDGMSLAALDRHRSGVNVSFLDGHAEYVVTEGLWKLKWSREFVAKQVTVKR